MALKDLIRPAPQTPTPAAQRPPGVTCAKYVRGEGKRCLQYVVGGACALPDELMCLQWLKANEAKASAAATTKAPETVATEAPKPARRPRPKTLDLFAGPFPPPAEAEPPLPPEPTPAPATEAPSHEAPTRVSELRGFTTEDIDGFKALGIEVQLRSEGFGDVWLVPSYTGKPRKELTPEHAATVARVLSVFPGSRVLAFTKSPNPERPERPSQERP